jgi:hypothetical protein
LWTIVGICASVEPEAAFSSEQRAIMSRSSAHPAAHTVSTARNHRLLDLVLNPHRALCLPGECDGDRLDLCVGLTSKAAADVRHNDPDRTDWKSKYLCDLCLDEKWVLA